MAVKGFARTKAFIRGVAAIRVVVAQLKHRKYEVCSLGNEKTSGEALFISISSQNLVSFKITTSYIYTLLHVSLPILENLLKVVHQKCFQIIF